MASPNLPVYMQVAVFLREGILTGKYPHGKIPATAFLRRRFHTSTTTVSNVYAELEKDGLIARGPYRPPLIVARAQPYQPDGRYIEAVTGDGRALFCQRCWARVPLGPRANATQPKLILVLGCVAPWCSGRWPA
jgi:DNA-binding transcriptional MocR family regulator